MSELVSLTKNGSIGVITVNNPPVNALSPGVPEGLVDCVEAGNADDGIEAMVLIGGGRGFIAGADIKHLPSQGGYILVETAAEEAGVAENLRRGVPL